MQLRKFVLPVVAVALSVTACGGDDSSSTDDGDAASADGDTASEESSEDAEESDDEAADEEADAGEGDEVDEVALFEAIADAYVEAGSFEFESAVSQDGQELTVTGAMEVDSDGSFANMQMSTNQAGVESSILMIDGQVYIEMTEEMGMPGSEASWLTFTEGGENDVGEDMTSGLEDVGSFGDISVKLDENAELLTVTEVGSASVEGVETTEYHAVVNDVPAYMGTEGIDGATEVSFTMWVDGDDMVRRMVQESDISGPVEMVYKNYGVDVDISAPPEDAVIDFNEMMNQ